MELLDVTQNGSVKQSKNNCAIVLRNDPVLKGAFCRNLLTDRVEIVKPMPWNCKGGTITDTDCNNIYMYMEKYDLRVERNIDAAIDVVANENEFHPIIDLLGNLEWDGVPRVKYALHRFLGADVDELSYECLKLFMFGALERIYNPGCKFEYMLCLVGGQGNGKSSFFRLLALSDSWFTDDLRKLDDEMVFRKMQGHWIIEMPEMLATAAAKTIEDNKAFLSRQKDTYKVPYEKHPKDMQRQCVFCGTSNKMAFLPFDRSGNRRFLPIETNMEQAEIHILADEDAAREYMKQMWAEIMMQYKAKEYSLKLSPDMEKQVAERRMKFMAEDTTAGLILSYLEDCKEEYVCTHMIAKEALGIFDKPDRRCINEINDIMNHCVSGWYQPEGKTRRFRDYGIQKYWCRVNQGLSNVNRSDSDADGFIKVPEQMELPFD